MGLATAGAAWRFDLMRATALSRGPLPRPRQPPSRSLAPVPAPSHRF